MNARRLSINGPALLDRALQSHLSILPHVAVYELEPNRTIARVSRRLPQPGQEPPATPENGTGILSREHVKHKNKRSGCRLQKNDGNLYSLFR
jgi:hypothetical protein